MNDIRTDSTDSLKAILLRSTDYGESDRIIALLTDQLGKVNLIARNARISRKRFMGALEPFSLLKVDISLGKDSLGILKQSRIHQAFPRIIQNLEKMETASVVIDLIRIALPDHQKEPALFSEVIRFFTLLDQREDSLRELLICFQVHVMALLGFAPRFDICGKCGKYALETQAGLFDPELGHLICRRCGGARFYLSAITRERLISALGENWAHAIDDWTLQQLQEAENVVTPFIENRVERRLIRGPVHKGRA